MEQSQNVTDVIENALNERHSRHNSCQFSKKATKSVRRDSCCSLGIGGSGGISEKEFNSLRYSSINEEQV